MVWIFNLVSFGLFSLDSGLLVLEFEEYFLSFSLSLLLPIVIIIVKIIGYFCNLTLS